MNTLDGRIILVSGAGGGLGGVAARALAAAGACVVLLDKAVNRLETLHDDILAAGHRQPAIYPLDLATAGDAEFAELAEILRGQFGLLHGLLHSAAELGALGPLADIKAAQFDKLLRVNLSAAHGLTRALLPLLQASGDGSLLFTSDSSARAGKAYWGAYGVAKIAVEGMARMWAEELGSAGLVRVNVLVPGPVNSPMRRRSHPGELPTETAAPESLAGRYVELLGPVSRGVHGQVIT
ncbi:MAG: SDR family NAD(P)-dependent oxidoreductase [Candidatus Methylumidiphilus sp.]